MVAPLCFFWGFCMSLDNRLASDWPFFKPYRGSVTDGSEIPVYRNGEFFSTSLDQLRKGIGVDGVVIVEDDYIEVFVKNNSNTNNITVTDLNVIVAAV